MSDEPTTTDASKWGTAKPSTPNEEFQKAMEKIVAEQSPIATPANAVQSRKEALTAKLVSGIEQCGKASFKLAKIRKDRKADPREVSDAAQEFRMAENFVQSTVNEFVTEIIKQEEAK
jgi:hypothetical protein